MTDEQIIKALECCATDDMDDCFQCPYDNMVYNPGYDQCADMCRKDALDLINRQKAEIEELKDILEKVPTNAYDLQVEASEKLENQIKSEAIKEFAERLKRKRIALTCEEPVYDLFKVGSIDNLVKEMTEPSEWNQRKEDEKNG